MWKVSILLYSIATQKSDTIWLPGAESFPTVGIGYITYGYAEFI